MAMDVAKRQQQGEIPQLARGWTRWVHYNSHDLDVVVLYSRYGDY
jgi:hypothetical protein